MNRIIFVFLALIFLMGTITLVNADREEERKPPPGAHPRQGMGPGIGPEPGKAPPFARGLKRGKGPVQARGMGAELGMRSIWNQLPAEKQKQIIQLQDSNKKVMRSKMIELRKKMSGLQKATQVFPLDRKEAVKQYDIVAQTRREAFELRIGMMAQVQQLVGKELWEKAKKNRGKSGPPPHRGPPPPRRPR